MIPYFLGPEEQLNLINMYSHGFQKSFVAT